MITLRKASFRGLSQNHWLESWHTFSFGHYYDPQFLGFSDLRVINEDFLKGGLGFNKHPHNNMEIITYVIDGALEHKDSLGTGSIIKPGEIQRMTAGTGVEHSEFNHSPHQTLHLLQIWILPETANLTPSYEQKSIPTKPNELHLIGSRDGGANGVTIHQDVKLYCGKFTANNSLSMELMQGRKAWLQLIKGELNLNSAIISAGDGVAIENEQKLSIACNDDAEFLLFDLR